MSMRNLSGRKCSVPNSKGRALVTGATGFIGIHTVTALVAQGWQVRCLVRPTSNRRPLAAYPVEYVVGSLHDRGALRRAVEDVKVIFHLAGATKARMAAEYEQVNYIGTQNLLEACASLPPPLPALLYVSSIAAAGPSPCGIPLKESDPPRPVGPYGLSKLRAEEAVLACKTWQRVMVLRPSAIYGPWDTDFLALFRLVRRGILPCIGWRELYLDLCFVADLVRGLLAAARSPHGWGEVFFLGGAVHTWRDLGATIARQAGRRVREVHIPRALVFAAARGAEWWARLWGRAGILTRANLHERLQPFWLCDSGKARRTFGYAPRVSLSQGVAETWRWYRQAGWL